MKTKNLLSILGVATVLGLGCGSPETGPQEKTQALQSADDVAVLALVNDQQNVTFEVLDIDCGLRSDAAANIIAHRDGPNGSADDGGFDDNLFETLEELDSVSRVGPATLEQLKQCADSFGYLPTPEELVMLNFLNDAPHTTEYRLDVECGLRSDAAHWLVVYRDGADGIDGTQDDNLFHSVDEVDFVAQVGPVTLQQLEACAHAFNYDKKNQAPAPLYTTGAALELAKECITDFIRTDRMFRPDWQAQLSYATTWEDAVYWGMLDYIDNFGDAEYCVDTEISDEGTHYEFFGASAFDLWTDVHVDKVTGECLYVRIEID